MSAHTFDPTQYADLLFGVGSATSAGPSCPSGSIHPSPETLEKDCGGYYRQQPIVGFGHAYTSGSGGVKCYGNFLLSPFLGEITLDHAKRAAFATEECARCYEYRVTLDNGIRAKVTPTPNAALHSFVFPAEADAAFLIDAAHKLDIDAAMRHGTLTIDPENRRISGGGLFFGNWGDKDWEMFFALEFDTAFTEIGRFVGDEVAAVPPDRVSVLSIDDKQRLGAYVKFGTAAEERTVHVKIAVSFVSVEKAQAFLDSQIPQFDYDTVCAAACNAWCEVMRVIELDTDDTRLLRRFYTALYHMNLQPRDRTSDHGTWDDFHTVWDSWKTVFPMYCLLYPKKMGSIIDSMIDRAHANRACGNGIVLADEYTAGKETLAGQGGNDVDNVIVDACLKDVPLTKHTWDEAYEVLLQSAEQMRSPEYLQNGFATDHNVTASGVSYTWRFKSAAATMGFALNDKAVAAMARKMGHIADAEKYEARAANFLHVWNPENQSEGFVNFPQTPREDGSFDSGFDPHGGYNSHFYEATAWDASYINYNDMPRLVEAMGGADTFTERLKWACDHSVKYYNDDHGAEGYLNFTNEPSFHIPWMFCTDEIRRPDLAAEVVDRVIQRFSLENDYPGDEDNGGMSSYYVFMMCGFFPFATTDRYYLHGTRVKRITFRLGNGRRFTVSGENVGEGNIYVQSATWQGQPLTVCRLTHEQLMQGGELHYVMGNTPSDWARADGK